MSCSSVCGRAAAAAKDQWTPGNPFYIAEVGHGGVCARRLFCSCSTCAAQHERDTRRAGLANKSQALSCIRTNRPTCGVGER
jgi:hypothetical protein